MKILLGIGLGGLMMFLFALFVSWVLTSAPDTHELAFGSVTLEKWTDAAWHPVLRLESRLLDECDSDPEAWLNLNTGLSFDGLGITREVPVRLACQAYQRQQ